MICRAHSRGARERAQGLVRGPAHGLPVLLKDLIDVKGMYTSNENYSLRESFPEEDSGVVKKLRASGVVILGKLGLSEYANNFGSQPCLDGQRRRGQVRGPLHGIPVLLADVIDAKRLPTTGGSIALQTAVPRKDAELVPAGYGTGNQGRNPIGVTFVGAAFSEGTLLAAGYAFEQATNVRLAPSFTNPSMWRCVPGSTFFSPHHCHPGDRLASN